ncbi:MAG: tetratricopeptide repeat protein [bacterium]|nr:tetratricopeptide repeat protein [bacterium]
MKPLLTILIVTLLIGCSSGYNRTAAIQTAEKATTATDEAPSSDNTMLRQGKAALSQGEYSRALELFQEACQVNSSDWEALFYLGLVHSAQGDYSVARNFLERALNLVGNNRRKRGRLYCALAQSWEREGRVGPARMNYRTANNLDPESNEAAAALLRLSTSQSD